MDNSGNYTNTVISVDAIMELVSNVVMRYVAKSSIPVREKEDVEMAIIEKFLKQQDKINDSFQNRSSIKTYYIAVINRMCCEVIRSESKHWHSVSDVDMDRVIDSGPAIGMKADRPLILKKEIRRLSNVMLVFNEERCKVSLFLKYLFDIPMTDSEIREYTKDKFGEVRTFFNRDEEMSQAEVYNALAHIANRVEGKEVKGDAIRMWMNKQIELILNRMNNHDESNHGRESLKILLEMKDSDFQSAVSKRSFWTLKSHDNER